MAQPTISPKPIRHGITARWLATLIPSRMRLCTVVVVSLAHVVAVISTLAFAKLHDFIENSPQLRADFEQLGTMLFGYFQPVRWTCYAAAICHSLALGHIIYHAIATACAKSNRIVAHAARINRFASVMLTSQGPHVQLISRTARWKRLKAFVSGLMATYPTEIVQIRILLELTLQTFQANKMSKLVATVWINRLLACVIVVNCWFSPIVYAVMKHKSSLETRVVRLSIDTLMDAIYCFGIPLAILYPYIVDFQPMLGSFPYDNYVTDTWTAVASSETKQLFVSSWMDFVSKVSPWFFFCYRLWSLRRLVTIRSTADQNTVKPSSKLARLLNAVLIGWGLAVAAIHLQVSSSGYHKVSVGCVLEVRPWFKTSRTCTVVEVSCTQRLISGTESEIADALAEVDVGEIQNLIFSHCPNFEMPPEIKTLTNVAMIKFFNSTIQKWELDAALTEASNGNVQQFFAIQTNFTSFPEGLLSPDMSETLRDVKFISTNLTTLPDSLSVAFRGVKYFVIEDSLLGEVPRAIARLPNVLFSSMGSNGISSIPPYLLQNLTARQIRFVNNPLVTIPETVGKQGQVLSVVVTNTKAENLPESWLASKNDSSLGHFIVEAQSTPLCERLLSGGGWSMFWGGRGFHIGRFTVMCDDRHGYYQNISYPVDKERVWRQANRLTALGVRPTFIESKTTGI